MALLLPAFIWPRVSPLFHVMMLCFREGCSRILGTGLGRTTLYMRGVRDGVVDVFAGSGVPGPREVSDTAAGVWPAVVAGVAAISGIWAGLGWSIALVHKTTSLLACSAHPPRMRDNGGNAAIVGKPSSFRFAFVSEITPYDGSLGGVSDYIT